MVTIEITNINLFNRSRYKKNPRNVMALMLKVVEKRDYVDKMIVDFSWSGMKVSFHTSAGNNLSEKKYESIVEDLTAMDIAYLNEVRFYTQGWDDIYITTAF